ncbi:hypothetical protein F4824DRAFT_500931 [Ustulina deusta]|nr:hypothetical protein F4823DRAFT_563998 [Ustulina deusta]KAI3335692.1 hypothetical protein F4824DRAFT_500931 [Ustulina deusta]
MWHLEISTNVFLYTQGATHVDTSVLGIGEGNGITPLMARIVVTAPAYTKSKYNPKELKALESLVTDAVEVNISLGTILSLACVLSLTKLAYTPKPSLTTPS